MLNPRKEDLLIKYFSKQANAAELDELENWIIEPKNEIVLKDFVKAHYAITIGMNNSNPNKIKERLLYEMRKDKSAFRNRKMNSLLKYAAIAVVFMGIGYFFQQYRFGIEYKKNVISFEEAITLETSNGEVQELSDKGSYQVKDKDGNILGEQKANKLVYHKTKNSIKLVYNVVKVPYGKKFDIFLSDGTHVFLNAGSSLKYPVNFLEGKQRHVFLEGEGYFEVAHDPTTPFLVGTQELNVKVYGTRFNVSNYASDTDIDVVLLEGSVGLETEKNNSKNVVKLNPGFKGAFDKSKKTLSTEKVDTTLYTAWMDDNLVFRNATFATIIKKLERQYNVVIINNNDQLSKETFNATFETNRESLKQVFEYFNEIYNIDYQFFNNKVVIE